MRGNRLIKEIKALQKRYGHDVEILLRNSMGLRDVDFGTGIVGVRNGDYVMFGTIMPIGDTYMTQERIIHDIMSARHHGRYRGYENCPTFPCLSPQEQLAGLIPVTGGRAFTDEDVPF